jgi:NitT/TauT family transport system ATP-binding protein
MHDMDEAAVTTVEKTKYGEMQLENAYKVYGSLVALADCSFKISRGKFTCLVGPSGAGKSVIIKLLAGYETPDGGRVLMDGKPVTGPGSDRIVVFQESALLPWKTLMENTMFGPIIEHKLSRQEAKHKAQTLIDKSGLTGFENKYPFQLSGGMQRRAEVIRVLINEPRVMLMDEPLRGLDAMTRQIMQEYIIKMYEETGITILFITSDIDEAIYIGDTVYFLTLGPGKIKNKIDIGLPRPRTYRTLTSNEFFNLKAEAIRIVMGELKEQ